MKIVEINSVYKSGSTGRIAADISETIKKHGDECVVCYGYGKKTSEENYKFTFTFERLLDCALTRLLDKHSESCYLSTIKLISFLKKYKPDIVHLHNIHGYYLNYKLLFKYLAKSNSKVVWTLHDCWPITGHCAYFQYPHLCEGYKTGCQIRCVYKKNYPSSLLLSNSKRNFSIKQKYFTLLPNNKMTIVAPSCWLKEIVSSSYLSKYRCVVINNGIDTSIFAKEEKTNFKAIKGINNRIVLLAVAKGLDDQKGLQEYIKLSYMLSNKYVLVIVGSEGKKSKFNSENTLFIRETSCVEELVNIYSDSDIFVNLTLADNYPTVNLESISCGLPVITYNTGGSPESVTDGCGIIVEQYDLNGVINAIDEILNNYSLFKNSCLNKSKDFDKRVCFEKYYQLFKELI